MQIDEGTIIIFKKNSLKRLFLFELVLSCLEICWTFKQFVELSNVNRVKNFQVENEEENVISRIKSF